MITEVCVWLHVVLLLGVIATPVVLGIRCREGPRRSIGAWIRAVVPYLPLAILCMFLMSTKGVPTIEWFYPALASLALVIVCRSERCYLIAWRGLFYASLFMCGNVLYILSDHDYCRDKVRSLRVANIRSRNHTLEARDAIQKAHATDVILKERRVSAILKDPTFDELDIVTFELEWHTILTFIGRLKREKAALWYPGGKVEEASQRLELRPLAE